MHAIQAIILGVVEGITEFLPISSTGHLILVSKLLGLADDSFTKSFNIIIQLGSIAAVVVVYWNKIISNLQLGKKVIVGFIPTAILGLIFYKGVKSLLGNSAVAAWAILIGGIILIAFEVWHNKKYASLSDNSEKSYAAAVGEVREANDITYKQAAWVGVFQSVAFIPGVSRSAATIVGGQLIGIGRKAIVEFSFLLAIPTMLAATGLDVLHQAKYFSGQNISLLLIGFVVSFLVAWAAIKTFLSYIQTHSFIPFGIYRIIIGIIFLFVLFY